MKPLRVALADDEPLARTRLSRLLREAGCEVVTELDDGPAVLDWLRRNPSVDALFLDIQMPGATGFEVMAELPERLPVVFVTAYAEHAVRAFEAAAVDYVLKPVSSERLAKSLTRLRERPTASPAAPPPPATGRYPAKAGDGHVFLDLRRTSHFEVEDEIVWAWCGGNRFRTGWSTLAEVEQAFPAAGLLRIQRHLLIRPDAILSLRPLEGGRAALRIAEGPELEASRTATPKLKERLGL